MNRCWLQGKLGDALHTVLCAAGYNLRWLMRAALRLRLRGVLLRFVMLRLTNRFLEKTTLSLQSLRVYRTAPW